MEWIPTYTVVLDTTRSVDIQGIKNLASEILKDRLVSFRN